MAADATPSNTVAAERWAPGSRIHASICRDSTYKASLVSASVFAMELCGNETRRQAMIEAEHILAIRTLSWP